MYCDHSQPPSPPLPRPTLLPFQANFVLPPIKANVWCPNVPACTAFHSSTVQKIILKNHFSLPASFCEVLRNRNSSVVTMTTNFHLGLPYHGSAQYTVTEEVKRRQTHYASERFSFGIRLLYIPECILINYQSLSKLAIIRDHHPHFSSEDICISTRFRSPTPD